MTKHTMNLTRPRVAKQIYMLDLENYTQEHYSDMTTLVDRMFDVRQPFVFTIKYDSGQKNVITGDFNTDGKYDITARIIGWKKESLGGITCQSISVLWSLHIHHENGKLIKVEPSYNSWAVQRVAGELITEARKKKDLTILEFAKEKITRCEAFNGKQFAASPRKALFDRIKTAQAWIERQPARKPRKLVA